MDCRPCWYVQSLDDGAFLAPDGEGGIDAAGGEGRVRVMLGALADSEHIDALLGKLIACSGEKGVDVALCVGSGHSDS